MPILAALKPPFCQMQNSFFKPSTIYTVKIVDFSTKKQKKEENIMDVNLIQNVVLCRGKNQQKNVVQNVVEYC